MSDDDEAGEESEAGEEFADFTEDDLEIADSVWDDMAADETDETPDQEA